MTPEVLVFMPYNPGDVVMALHAAAQIRALLPGSSVDFLTGEECLDLVQVCAGLRRVRAVPRRDVAEKMRMGEASGAAGKLGGWIADLETRPYGLALNLFQGRWGGMIQAFVCAERKAGLELKDGACFDVGSRALEHLFAVPARRSHNPFHAVDVYRMAVAEALGLALPSAPPPRPEFSLPENPVPFSARSYLALHPGAAYRGKRWPAARWIRLAERCLGAGRNVVWTGSGEERAFVQSIVAGLPARFAPNQCDLSGATTLPQAAAVYAGAERVVCGDTAAMHLAAAAGTPVLALFGPSNPVETGPYGPGHLVLQTRPVERPDLRLDEDCAELGGIEADAVAALLLSGSPSSLPPHSLWRTDWNAKTGTQMLHGLRGERHPFQAQTEAWLDILLDQNLPRDPGNLPLSQALAAAQASPTAQALRTLEQAEESWARDTHSDLVWEAYRVGLNGLPVLPLPLHFRLRGDRLRRAMRETKRWAVVPTPSPG